MYRIIGGDKRQYGPVSAEEICQWIASGRADGQTLAVAGEGTDWRALSAFPEFAEALTAAGRAAPESLPPGAPPTLPGAVDPKTLTDSTLARNVTVDIGGALGRGWRTLTGDFWPVLGVSVLVAILLSVTNAIYVGILLVGPLMGGLFLYYLKKIRGQAASVNDVFSGFTVAFLQLLLCGLVSTLLTSFALMLCVLPGIYLAVAWQFAIPLTLDKGMGFWDAMEVSRKVISKQWWSFFGLAIVCVLLNLAGTLALLVGVFITGPWTLLAWMHLYEDHFSDAQVRG